ncbi:50S ribosomal protein L1 [Candidatus Phytoplasma pini]|nr:50S ribosomal protein L1 [Candidatus Phytoplasma pini]
MKRSKKYLSVSKYIDFKKLYKVVEAIELIKQTRVTKFEPTVECNLSLKLDPKKVEQNLRGVLFLPYGSGKKSKILVLTKGLKAKQAEEAGADFVGEDELIDKIYKGWLEFDVLIATPDMMPSVSKLGRILGPKGLMPNPKVGTMTDNVVQAITDIQKGCVEYRVDKTGNIHTILGKYSFDKEKLIENLIYIYKHFVSVQPKIVKNNFFKSMTISNTMAPGIKIDFLSI